MPVALIQSQDPESLRREVETLRREVELRREIAALKAQNANLAAVVATLRKDPKAVAVRAVAPVPQSGPLACDGCKREGCKILGAHKTMRRCDARTEAAPVQPPSKVGPTMSAGVFLRAVATPAPAPVAKTPSKPRRWPVVTRVQIDKAREDRNAVPGPTYAPPGTPLDSDLMACLRAAMETLQVKPSKRAEEALAFFCDPTRVRLVRPVNALEIAKRIRSYGARRAIV